MLKKLKIRFVATIMIILSLVFVLIIGSINYFNYQSNERQSATLLKSLVDNDGLVPQDPPVAPNAANPLPPGVYERERTFSVRLDTSQTPIAVNGGTDFSELSPDMTSLMHAVLASGKKSGSMEGYRYLVAEKSYGQILVFVDQRISNEMMDRLITTSLIIGGISLFVLFFISLFLANLMVKPVEEAFEKQKRFISDASHELKTPLSVITVNADVLEGDIGTNKYLSYIQSESARMNGLVNNLLTLAKLDSLTNQPVFCEFDFSNAILSIALTFESTAFEENKRYELNIDPGIFYVGDPDKLKQVAAILIDNAIKHADDEGLVVVSVKKVGDKIQLAVFNSGLGIPEDQQTKIFERFYRYDESRSKDTGGYGLGLAIAKSIVDEHKGKIKVKSEINQWVKFIVTL